MTDNAEAVRRGHEAAQLLERLEPYLASLEAEYIALWRNPQLCKTTELREEAWQRLRVVADVRRHIGIVIDGGKIADHALEQQAHQVR